MRVYSRYTFQSSRLFTQMSNYIVVFEADSGFLILSIPANECPNEWLDTFTFLTNIPKKRTNEWRAEFDRRFRSLSRLILGKSKKRQQECEFMKKFIVNDCGGCHDTWSSNGPIANFFHICELP